MEEYPFELGPIRPVDERNSLLIRTTRGCPWNKCEFCVNYQGMRFSMRTVEDIKKDIVAAAQFYAGRTFNSCFLQDGDSFFMKTADLIEILNFLKQHFPGLKSISSYGRAQTMMRKSRQEIQEICDAGLNQLYCGMESGCDQVLKKINKGVNSAEIIESSLMAKSAGMKISEFIILGLGGTSHWQEHALDTARALNKIDPDFIRVLTIGVKKGSGLEKQMLAQEYQLQTEKNIIEEQRLLIDTLEGITSFYANHHGVDLLMEARGQLPEDKPKLLAIMDRFLSLTEKDQLTYIMGKRIGYFQYLDDLLDEERKRIVAAKLQQAQEEYPGTLEQLFHHLRSQVV
ncbi:MAG: radical SAM protein [Proteobacteria bacterium]|nr:radical SAM protein [Pseudomonadota bacterium]MBU1687698.1 radical SAM protein [Pseudomonadota bacterium]